MPFKGLTSKRGQNLVVPVLKVFVENPGLLALGSFETQTPVYLPVQCCYLSPTGVTGFAILEWVPGAGSRAGLALELVTAMSLGCE